MNAKVIFINEQELQDTGYQYALASAVLKPSLNKVFISLDDVIDFVQTSQNAAAEEMIKLQEKMAADGQQADTTTYQAEWRTYNWILSELKKYSNR